MINIQKKHKYKSFLLIYRVQNPSLPVSSLFLQCCAVAEQIPPPYPMWMPEEKQACWRAGFCVCACVEGPQGERGREGEEKIASKKPHFSYHSSNPRASLPKARQPKRDWHQKHRTTYKDDVFGKPVQPLSGHFLEFCYGQRPRLTRKQN